MFFFLTLPSYIIVGNSLNLFWSSVSLCVKTRTLGQNIVTGFLAQNIDGLPLTHSHQGTWPVTQASAQAGNRTGEPLVCRPALNPLSHTSQGNIVSYLKKKLCQSLSSSTERTNGKTKAAVREGLSMEGLAVGW